MAASGLHYDRLFEKLTKKWKNGESKFRVKHVLETDEWMKDSFSLKNHIYIDSLDAILIIYTFYQFYFSYSSIYIYTFVETMIGFKSEWFEGNELKLLSRI